MIAIKIPTLTDTRMPNTLTVWTDNTGSRVVITRIIGCADTRHGLFPSLVIPT